MTRSRKSKADEPSTRDRLSADFIEALAADWKQFGASVIVAMREESPVKYSELVARLIPLETAPSDPFANAQSAEDIGRRLLEQVGLSTPRPDQIERAVTENDDFVVRLQAIATGN
jgi:hypothetical protein